MKKNIIRTIIVFIVINLITAGFTLAQDVIEEENQDVLSMQTQEEAIAQRNAEVAEKAAERQAIIAQEKMKAAEKQIKDAEKQQMDIEREMKDLMVNIRIPDVTLPHLEHLQHGGSGGGVIVIPSAEMKVENLAAITEDISIMSRIFDKQLNQSNVQTARGRFYGDFNLFFGRGNRTTEAIYLEGYGALFLMNVKMPLSAPPEAQQQKEKAEEDTDPVWAQMKREMYEPEGVQKRRANDIPEQKYDAEKVETLKTNLIKTLKHATNIHALKPDQLVILTVIGSGRRSASTITQSFSYGRSTGSRSVVQTVPEGETDSLLPTVLTIRAKKSYIDALAQNKIDFEEFEEKVQLLSYPCLGENLSRGLSPSFLRGETISIVPGSSSAGRSGRSAGRSSRRRGSRSSGVDSMEPDDDDIDSMGQSSGRSGRR